MKKNNPIDTHRLTIIILSLQLGSWERMREHTL
jgi:hypothetical protein